MLNSHFKMSYDIENNDHKPIHVRLKGGIEYKVSKSEHPTFNKSPSVLVALECVDLRELKLNPQHALTVFDRALLKKITAVIAEEIECAINPDTELRNKSIKVNLYLNNELVEKNNAIHSELLGFTLYTGDYDREIPPLNTPFEVLDEMHGEQDKTNSINISFELIDPTQRAGVLWTNLLGEAKPIYRSQGRTQPEGLYVVLEGNRIETKRFHIPLDDITNKLLQGYGIFMTEREAIEGGNSKALLQLEDQIKELRKENRQYEGVFRKQSETIQGIESKLVALQSDLSRTKHTSGMKDLFHKHEVSMLKSKSSQDDFGNLVKNTTAVCSLGITLYKLLT